MNKKANFAIIIFLVIIVIIGIIWLVGSVIMHNLNAGKFDSFKYTPVIPENEDDIVEYCNGLGLRETSACLVANIETFYEFKLSKDDIYPNLDNLKENGGDCSDYSKLYASLGKKLGFKPSVVTFKFNETMSHSFTILQKEGRYCIIDQIIYRCF